jgi:hypothetical protein
MDGLLRNAESDQQGRLAAPIGYGTPHTHKLSIVPKVARSCRIGTYSASAAIEAEADATRARLLRQSLTRN